MVLPRVSGDALAEEAFEHFFRFGRVVELALRVCGGEAVGKGAVLDAADHGNRLGKHGFQIVGQVVLRVVQQGGFEPHHQRFGRGKPAALVAARFDGDDAAVLQQAVLVVQHFLRLPAE